MREAEENHYDYLIVNLFKELNFRDEKTVHSRCIAQTLSGKSTRHVTKYDHFVYLDNALDSSYWQQFIIAKLTALYSQCDSPYEHVRERAEATVTQEIDYAIHLGIEKILIDLPDVSVSPGVENLSRIINRYLQDRTIS